MIVSLIFDNYKKRLIESYTTVLDSKDSSTNGRRYDNIMRDVNYFKTKLEHIEGAGNTGQVIYDTVSGLYKIEEIFNADEMHESEPKEKTKVKETEVKEPEVKEPEVKEPGVSESTGTPKETENAQEEKKDSTSSSDDTSTSKDTKAKPESADSASSEEVIANETSTEKSSSTELDRSEPDATTDGDGNVDAEVDPRSSVSSDEKSPAVTPAGDDSDGDKKA